jgi:aminocarboxymuconate-semialdehyde decarboxylase
VKPVIDAHAHFLPSGAVKASKTGELWQGLRIEVAANSAAGVTRVSARPTTEAERTFRRIPEYFQTPEQRLAAMKASGVDVQVLSLTPALFRYDLDVDDAVAFVRDVNDDLHDLTKRWPENFRGFGSLPAQDTDASVAEIERCMTKLGLDGVMVDTHVNGEDWDSPRLFPILQAAEALGAVVFFHPGMQRVAKLWPRYHLRNLIGNPLETTVVIASLIFGGVLDRLPNAKMYFAHGGGFACANVGRFDHGHKVRLETKGGAQHFPSEYLRRLFFDPITMNEIALRTIIDVAGGSQVVLGTDFPADMAQDRPYDWIMSLSSLSEDEKQGILRNNVTNMLARRRPA